MGRGQDSGRLCAILSLAVVDAFCFTGLHSKRVLDGLPLEAGFCFRHVRPLVAPADRCRMSSRQPEVPRHRDVVPSKLDLWDAHCHVHLSKEFEGIANLQDAVKLSLMGTRTSDWKDISTLSTTYPTRVLPAFGLHPWWAHEDHGNWEEELEGLLSSHPHACVGEIGLDKQWVPPGLEVVQYEAQMKLFHKQLDIATRHDRPVSLHCVAAYGDVFDTLRLAQALPPALYLHSFGGKAGMLNSFVKMKGFGDRFFFGFSAAVNLRSPKTRDVIKLVPDDRLLLESDLEEPGDVEPCLRRMLEVVAEAKGWSVEHAAAVTRSNAQAFVRAGSHGVGAP